MLPWLENQTHFSATAKSKNSKLASNRHTWGSHACDAPVSVLLLALIALLILGMSLVITTVFLLVLIAIIVILGLFWVAWQWDKSEAISLEPMLIGTSWTVCAMRQFFAGPSLLLVAIAPVTNRDDEGPFKHTRA